ncbi:hypothetical protein C5Y97_17265 [Blastopirellula marina]|uniref:Uncharacterized protein n=2 Tax=Blastopirellula marina TaxID=124 RepID=A0A2S8FQ36_9BACT|nr:hypothetical protein C5Y98_17255 [Blastopirellula marina]PTL43750.1 hypothetical protein C5Y97_17265 [Blastopirellula marina]
MWQYYEGVTQCDFRKAYDLLNKYDLPWIAVVYQQGQAANRCHDLDIWIEENWSQLEEAAIDLIADYRDSLYPLPKM